MGHPNKHIREAIDYAKSKGFKFQTSKGHAYGRLFSPEQSREGHIMSVWSTPKNPVSHARRIIRFVDSYENTGENNG